MISRVSLVCKSSKTLVAERLVFRSSRAPGSSFGIADRLARTVSSKETRASSFIPSAPASKPTAKTSKLPQKDYTLQSDIIYKDSFWPSTDSPSVIFGLIGAGLFGYGFWDMSYYEMNFPEWYYLAGGTAAWIIGSFEYVLNWRSFPFYVSSIRLHPDKTKLIVSSGVFSKKEKTYLVKDISYRTLVKHLHKEQEWTYVLELKDEQNQSHRLEMCARPLWNKGNLKVQHQVMEDVLKGDVQELLRYRFKSAKTPN